MADQPPTDVQSIVSKSWEWRFAAFWFILFSVQSLGSAIMVSLIGSQWSDLDGQSRFMIKLAIAVNWTGTMMAFISKSANRIKKTGEIFSSMTGDDTGFIARKTTERTVGAAVTVDETKTKV